MCSRGDVRSQGRLLHRCRLDGESHQDQEEHAIDQHSTNQAENPA